MASGWVPTLDSFQYWMSCIAGTFCALPHMVNGNTTCTYEPNDQSSGGSNPAVEAPVVEAIQYCNQSSTGLLPVLVYSLIFSLPFFQSTCVKPSRRVQLSGGRKRHSDHESMIPFSDGCQEVKAKITVRLL